MTEVFLLTETVIRIAHVRMGIGKILVKMMKSKKTKSRENGEREEHRDQEEKIEVVKEFFKHTYKF